LTYFDDENSPIGDYGNRIVAVLAFLLHKVDSSTFSSFLQTHINILQLICYKSFEIRNSKVSSSHLSILGGGGLPSHPTSTDQVQICVIILQLVWLHKFCNWQLQNNLHVQKSSKKFGDFQINITNFTSALNC